MSKKKISPLPPTGSFPGYKRGAALFNIWAQALFEQSNIWNDVWSKVKGKSLKLDHAYQAVVRSVESSADSTEKMVETLTGSMPKSKRARRKTAKGAGKKTAKRAKMKTRRKGVPS